jgi:hypothetical protein
LELVFHVGKVVSDFACRVGGIVPNKEKKNNKNQRESCQCMYFDLEREKFKVARHKGNNEKEWDDKNRKENSTA